MKLSEKIRKGEEYTGYGTYADEVADLEARLEAMEQYSAHLPECWKNASVRELGVGGRLASCTCGYSELLQTTGEDIVNSPTEP